MKAKRKIVNGVTILYDLQWSESDDIFIVKRWDDPKWTVDRLAAHFKIKARQLSIHAKHIGLGHKAPGHADIKLVDETVLETIREKYEEIDDLQNLSKEIGISVARIKSIARSLNLKRVKKRPRKKRLYVGKKADDIQSAKEILASVGLTYDFENHTDTNSSRWQLPKGYVRHEVKDTITDNFDCYEVQDMTGYYIATIKVKSRTYDPEELNNEYSPSLARLRSQERVYMKSVETRALSMVVDLPFQKYKIVDSEGVTVLERTPGDYFDSELEMEQHRAMLAAWRISINKFTALGFTQINKAVTRIKELKADQPPVTPETCFNKKPKTHPDVIL